MIKRAIYLAVFLLFSVTSLAQINVYMGGNLQGNVSWIRGDEATGEPGFGTGVSFVYWEFEYWFLKTGIDYNLRNSSVLDYPDVFEITPEGPEDKIRISYREHTVGIPISFYFRPFESGGNTLLLTATLNTMVVAGLQAKSEEYGAYALKGTDIKNRVKSSFGLGVGYQRQLDEHMFLNLLPSYNMDFRGDKAFNSLVFTAELIFGIY
jgi:hypothetical protein